MPAVVGAHDDPYERSIGILAEPLLGQETTLEEWN